MASQFRRIKDDAIQIKQHDGLPNKLLNAFHQACDEGDPYCGLVLLELLELELQSMAPSQLRTRALEGLIMAYEKLWQLCPTALPFALRSTACGLAH
ncbi:hypothetical protein CR162_17310 [Pseudoroseomonas rhizosphaerae]|uniref:Uncharacterized protein n=1 Tax=Teichococcus rhizosphaerae TaxID=1335062 RepID=A0A2C7A5K9_9PROT|nr:hypothetical protein [Pseudoroseomonas rhizosphaerae]PHK93630.1 hypothetical protein CR162_17310 [Pseudoroseomonas rhizosphaerae]